MYDRRFFRTRLGQAALASITAMAAFVVLSTQITPAAASPMMVSTTTQAILA
ncbi:MAG: hypothetical protein ABGW87_07020 [Sphingomonadaceae bacterium]